MIKNTRILTLIFFSAINLSCNTEWQTARRETYKETGYKLTRKDYKIIREIKKENDEADAITRERMKDPDYLEHIKKSNTEDSLYKKSN